MQDEDSPGLAGLQAGQQGGEVNCLGVGVPVRVGGHISVARLDEDVPVVGPCWLGEPHRPTPQLSPEKLRPHSERSRPPQTLHSEGPAFSHLLTVLAEQETDGGLAGGGMTQGWQVLVTVARLSQQLPLHLPHHGQHVGGPSTVLHTTTVRHPQYQLRLTLYPPTVRLILQGLTSSSCLLFISSTSIGGASVTLENNDIVIVGFCLVVPGP